MSVKPKNLQRFDSIPVTSSILLQVDGILSELIPLLSCIRKRTFRTIFGVTVTSRYPSSFLELMDDCSSASIPSTYWCFCRLNQMTWRRDSLHPDRSLSFHAESPIDGKRSNPLNRGHGKIASHKKMSSC